MVTVGHGRNRAEDQTREHQPDAEDNAGEERPGQGYP